jgi:hypothetical protein
MVARLQASELLALVQTHGVSVVCFADLPPSPSSKTRYLVKRLRAALPEVRILVGAGDRRRWRTRARSAAGYRANLVASTLLETRTYLAGLGGESRGFPFRRQTSRTLRRQTRGVADGKIWRPLRV